MLKTNSLFSLPPAQHEYGEPSIEECLNSPHNPFMDEAGFSHGFSAKFMDSMMRLR